MSAEAGEPTTILIVDDEPRVLDSLEAVLAAEFRVLRADGGPAALELLAREPRYVPALPFAAPDARAPTGGALPAAALRARVEVGPRGTCVRAIERWIDARASSSERASGATPAASAWLGDGLRLDASPDGALVGSRLDRDAVRAVRCAAR